MAAGPGGGGGRAAPAHRRGGVERSIGRARVTARRPRWTVGVVLGSAGTSACGDRRRGRWGADRSAPGGSCPVDGFCAQRAVTGKGDSLAGVEALVTTRPVLSSRTSTVTVSPS